MSYLLAALKQSEQGEVSRVAQNASESSLHYTQQKDLYFYRKLAFSLLALLAFVVILAIGFMAGRWFQGSKTTSLAKVNPGISTELKAPNNKPQEQTAIMQNAPIQAAPIIVQQAVPTQYQLVPVQNNFTTQAYQGVIQNPNVQNQIQHQVKNTQNQAIDYSQYKVVGKPIDAIDAKNLNIEDDEIAQLPTSLKTAFANAVAATEAEDDYEVTSATQDSAMAQPVQLLPDVIQALIPEITYQAHIYATDPTRRWIKLNDTELYEGDTLGPIKILEIAPEITLMSIEGYRFSLSAMDDWLP